MTRALGPRVVIAGVSSGVGKTTIATGLMAALTRRGTKVACAKVGPDYIDPGYHSLACRRPPRNLDPWICGPDAVRALAGRAAIGADVLVVEGVMGLFDGADDGTPSSTADVAVLLDAPVVLVVDASAMSSSAAAVVRGYRDHDPRVRLAGVICNRVGSDRHATLLREAIEPLGVPLIGLVRSDERFTWRDRHLGLVPVGEHRAAVELALDRLADAVARDVDLDAVMALARSAPACFVGEPVSPAMVAPCRIAVAAGPAFSFSYTDNLEALQSAGAEIVPFDPRREERLPDVDGLVIGGGFPEVFGDDLSANTSMLADARRLIGGGMPTWAECGGLLWLVEDLDGHRMVGAVPATATLGQRVHMGYREATTTAASPLGPAGTSFRGHEFHYSTCAPAGDAVVLSSRHGSRPDGFATPTMFASYLHHHAGGDASIVETFVRSVVRSRARSS